MASQNDQGFGTFVASGAIPAYIAVKLQSDGTITAAANDTKGIGITQEDVADAGYCNVKLWSAPGTFMVQASGSAITAATDYGIITGGYAGVVTTARITALGNGVASNGIVVEFAKI